MGFTLEQTDLNQVFSFLHQREMAFTLEQTELIESVPYLTENSRCLHCKLSLMSEHKRIARRQTLQGSRTQLNYNLKLTVPLLYVQACFY